MNRKYLFVIGLLFAMAVGTFLPQLLVGNVESSADEVTYQFVNLGMTTTETREIIEEILDGIVGVADFRIDPMADMITITLDPETMKPEWIVKSLEAHGYKPDEYHKVR
ncbi:hypothetical protein [Ammoniphilus sp. CFH 90114]|uniref:hypothetical protein n=1 Tax=Ammoniphilus sp. CFH 90114 TaxID=2493665 RepID=UPI00100E3D4B|nr:hypothetical protein [Ammoniphilus sp. CFH 90114]RXT14950.1 hypothetical protein EIZ39_01710 [Ammoniphilus sp. CFH 90114]